MSKLDKDGEWSAQHQRQCGEFVHSIESSSKRGNFTQFTLFSRTQSLGKPSRLRLVTTPPSLHASAFASPRSRRYSSTCLHSNAITFALSAIRTSSLETTHPTTSLTPLNPRQPTHLTFGPNHAIGSDDLRIATNPIRTSHTIHELTFQRVCRQRMIGWFDLSEIQLSVFLLVKKCPSTRLRRKLPRLSTHFTI